MIRKNIIAEGNAQLKAMGFFEEFAVLRSDMNPTKKQKMKKQQKKQPQTKDMHENNQVRRSERLFLSSPKLDLSEVKNKGAVVKDVIADIIHAASQENVFPILEQKMLMCADCGKRFKRREYMVKHDKLDHKKLMTIVCQHCDFKTNRIRVLRKHLVNQHSDNTVFDDQMYHYGRSSTPIIKVYCCVKCDFKAKLPEILTKHSCEAHGVAESELEVLVVISVVMYLIKREI